MLTMSKARAAFYEDRATNFVKYVFIWFKSLAWLARAGLRPDDVICVDNDAVLALEPRRMTETRC